MSTAPILAWGRRGSFSSRLLVLVLLTFSLAVALRLHGSSIALSAQVWAPDAARSHLVAEPLLERLSKSMRARLRAPLMAEPRYIRIDEWANEGTLYSLAQLSHDPPFPIVNTNVGTGQNMLVLPWAPVLHVTTLARPMTWGYLLLGPERGLAWSWWSQVVLGFVGLYFLLALVVPGEPWLATLGAAWFCGSAYVAFWSLWPAYAVGLGVLALVFAHRALTSDSPLVIVASGVGVGLAFAGFVMQLYPPWQVPLGHLFVVIFATLVVRDRAWRGARRHGRARLLALTLALALGAGLTLSFLHATLPALRALAESDYPGVRRAFGGDCPPSRLFGGFYNAFVKDYFPRGSNPSEAAGFFLLFPSVLVGVLVSPRLRSKLDAVAWGTLAVACFVTLFCATELPAWLARVTLLAHAPGYRAQIAVGLASIVLCVQVLAQTRGEAFDGEAHRTALIAIGVCAALYFWLGFRLERYLPFSGAKLWLCVLLVSAAAALAGALVLAGRSKPFVLALAASLVVTSADFNPLSFGFPDWRTSELGQAIRRVEAAHAARAPGEPAPLWLTYGGPDYPNGGSLVQLMGARALNGVHYHPQLALWELLDPEHDARFKYNRFAAVRLDPPERLGSRHVDFHLQAFNVLRVRLSPLHPELEALNARYVLTWGDDAARAMSRLRLLHRSEEQGFAIWELPERGR